MTSVAARPTQLHINRVLCSSRQRLQQPIARKCTPQATKVQVVETSLGLGVESKLLRHLGLRFNCDSDEVNVEGQDFSEAHFGPGSGAFQEGFLNSGKGMVAESEYKEVTNAGTTDKSVEECLEWCKKWSDGKLFVAVGQNCWSMVSEFLSSDQGGDLMVPESVQFREEQVNKWTELFVDAAQKKADKEGIEIGEVWEKVMDNPEDIVGELLSSIAPDSIQDIFPEGGEPGEMADEAKDAVKGAASELQGKTENSSEDKSKSKTDGDPLSNMQKQVDDVVRNVSGALSGDDK